MSRLVNKTEFPVLFTNLDRRMTLLLIPGPRSDFTFDKSSIMVTVGEAIALLSKYDRDQQIEAIADHDIAINRLFSLRRRPQRSSLKRGLRAIQPILKVDTISINSDLVRRLQNLNDPTNLLDSPEISLLHLEGEARAEQAFVHLYQQTLKLVERRALDIVIWRFLMLFFYDLQKLHGSRRLGVNKLATLKAAVKQSSGSSVDALTENVERWAKAGKHYSCLIDALVPGSVFLLPHEIHLPLWEKELPLQGESFNQVVQHLKNLNIEQISSQLRADEIATNIRAALIAPFSWHAEVNQAYENASVHTEPQILEDSSDMTSILPELSDVTNNAVLDSNATIQYNFPRIGELEDYLLPRWGDLEDLGFTQNGLPFYHGG